MFDQLVGLFLIGLGLQSPIQGVVKGDETVVASPTGIKSKEFRDTKKLELLQKRQQKLTEVYKKRIKIMTSHLDKLQKALDAIKSKVTTYKSNNVAANTSGLESAIASAQTAIDTARSAVSAQASKQPVIPVSTESKSESDAKSAIKAEKSALNSTHQTVVSAGQATRKAYEAWGQLRGKNVSSEGEGKVRIKPTSVVTQPVTQ